MAENVPNMLLSTVDAPPMADVPLATGNRPRTASATKSVPGSRSAQSIAMEEIPSG